jgi:hypothetical protein
MSKLIENDGHEDGDIINELSEAVTPIADKMHTSNYYAMLVLGAKYIKGEGKTSGVKAYINAVGLYEILADALYQGLRDQIANGQKVLFWIIRDVVHTLEEELGIDPEEEIDADDDQSNILH